MLCQSRILRRRSTNCREIQLSRRLFWRQIRRRLDLLHYSAISLRQSKRFPSRSLDRVLEITSGSARRNSIGGKTSRRPRVRRGRRRRTTSSTAEPRHLRDPKYEDVDSGGRGITDGSFSVVTATKHNGIARAARRRYGFASDRTRRRRRPRRIEIAPAVAGGRRIVRTAEEGEVLGLERESWD